jgi:ABC-type cobalamin/Fe3+-siderophores transport system ATPase subunit
MKLKGFRVSNFRSIEDSGWMSTDDVTALIGTNESGKTNILMPLWKLKPAKNGEINPLQDIPRKRYNEIRSMETKPVFIEAHFEMNETQAEQIASLTGASTDEVKKVVVKRTLDGTYYVDFPDANSVRAIEKAQVGEIVSNALADLTSMIAAKSDEDLKTQMQKVLLEIQSSIEVGAESLSAAHIKAITDKLASVSTEKATKTSIIAPRYAQVTEALSEIHAAISQPSASQNSEARSTALGFVPPFVYYSNYGNLDSEIYLPHVIENLKRTDLGPKEEGKARTLRVLFEFVRLKPEEILELGKDIEKSSAKPSDEEIQAIAEKKKERTVLLQSASTELTGKFRNWWRQGNYIFEFQADGDHFRIWVSDSVRPEKIELEGRSTGLQWFLSFYLIFLVESGLTHQNAILLLDEPGLSLHPIAQKDLSKFFENLSRTNQLLYTTHSPFMVDADHLDRVKAVYVDDNGNTVTSENLRAREVNTSQGQSIYAVYAALGLSVSDTLFLGCQSVIVEGQSDQIYLSFIKTYLIGKGFITPTREIVFPPAGGTRGVKPMVSILGAKDDDLPYVTLDSDEGGRTMAAQLRAGLYKGSPDRVLLVGDFVAVPDAEIEDLFPQEFIAKLITRYLQRLLAIQDDDFHEVVESGKPIIPQFEAYAAKNGVALPESWKVDIAKMAKESLLKNSSPVENHSCVDAWKELFGKYEPLPKSAAASVKI